MQKVSLDRLLAVIQPSPDAPPEGQTPSAVLIALINMADGEAGVILTERSAGLRYHAGQISFPGGRIDDDETPVEAALREAEEEIALDPKKVTVLGHLPGVVTTAGFHIAPVLGWVDSDFVPVAAPAEVERVLIEPIAPLLDRKRHFMVMRESGGRRYESWDISHEQENIWGATARILVQWGQLLTPDNPEQEAGT
jgi:8-oxo-dGTP pyrophosphatase MutT (NUDIX family)